MKKKHISNLVLCPSLAFLVFVLFLIPSFPVLASTGSGGSLPYNVKTYYGTSNYSDINSYYHSLSNNDVITAINNFMDYGTNTSYIGYISDITERINGDVRVYFTILVNPYITGTYSSNFNFFNNQVEVYGTYGSITLVFDSSNNFTGVYGYSGFNGSPSSFQFLGSPSVIDYIGGSGSHYIYTPSYPCLAFNLGPHGITDSNDSSVIIDKNVSVNPFPDPDRPGPEKRDYPDVEDPSSPPIFDPPYIPNPPVIDTTNIESLLSSIFAILQWGFNAVVSYFGSLVDFLGDLIGYVIESFAYFIQTIVDNIQAFANSVLSALEPIFQFFKSMIELGLDEDGNFSFGTWLTNLIVPSPEDVSDLVNSNDSFYLISFVNALVNKINSIITTITSITPVYKIYVPSCVYHGQQIGNFYIDFSWFQSYKNYYDAIVSAFLYIGYIFWLMVNVSAILRGNNSIATDPQRLGGE